MLSDIPNTKKNGIEIEQIIEMIPHRYPFLMIDRITEINPNKNAVGIKNVTINEPFFEGHFGLDTGIRVNESSFVNQSSLI